ncbi:unnamed protein product [Paramecium primaurelia]|uniref:Tetratricopeptide repeat protein 21A/21B C-terminal ARM domain-containing protein n=1 Tax=Paramecium primaurelia TaxID=5886 RepID=A0A8S1M2J6_PARPR|nr:unnamed protein product [Paramecium primaurelia]
MEPDPKLLSLLEKVNNPIELFKIQITVKGVYGFAEDWKLTDETNPGIFANVVRYQGEDMFGKIKGRELTEREKFEEYQKNSKKNKKDTKSPEEEEQMKKALALEEEEELKKQQHLGTLQEQDKLFFISEDKFKTISIQYEETHTIEIKNVRQLEEEILENRNFIYFIRQPAITEEELVKLKKGKTKNLNNAELTQIIFKGVFDLSDLLEPGCTRTTARAFLKQEENSDCPKYNCDKMYVKVEIETEPALTPLVEEIPVLNIEPIIVQRIPNKFECVGQFQRDIKEAMKALDEEYSKLNPSDQKVKVSANLTVQKRQELQKKKESFLNEINQSGKYKILQDRLRSSIIRVCIDKFAKEGLFVGVNKDEQDRLFAELYVFMMEEMQTTLGEYVINNKEDIHEDLYQTYDQNQRDRDVVFQSLKEQAFKKFKRFAEQYETINQVDQALKYYTNMVLVDPKSATIFAKYCFKIQRFKAAEQLIQMVRDIEWNKENELLMACLYIRRERFKEATNIVQALLQKEPINTLFNLLMSFIYKQQGNQNMADKYLRCTQRIFMRTMGLLTKGFPKQQPDPHVLPNFKQQMIEQQEKAKKAPVLTQEQTDQIQLELIEYFASRSLFDLAEKALVNIKDKTTQKINIIKAQIHIFNENYAEAQSLIQKILNQNPKNYEVYLIKGALCYQTDQFYEAEETFLKALSIQHKRSFDILLRLGYLYLKRKSWQDAKAIFERALDQQVPSNSSLTWLGLGISNLRLKDPIAEECLCQASIHEPFNGEVWGYQALNCLQQKRGQQAKQCLQRMEQTEVNDLDLLIELAEEMNKCQDFESCRQILMRVYNSKVKIPNMGQLLKNLGQVHAELRRKDEAKQYYEESLQYLESGNEKAKVIQEMKLL